MLKNTLKALSLLVVALLLVINLAGSSFAAEKIDRAAEKCVQSALNALGHNVGKVDGYIGKGTSKAFEKLRESAKTLPSFSINDFPASWCLFITEKYTTNAATMRFAKYVEDNAKVSFNLDVPRKSVATLEFQDKNGKVIASNTKFKTKKVGGKKVQATSIPFAVAKNTAKVCTNFADKWYVMGNKGDPKGYTISCDGNLFNGIPIMFIIDATFTMSYNHIGKQ